MYHGVLRSITRWHAQAQRLNIVPWLTRCHNYCGLNISSGSSMIHSFILHSCVAISMLCFYLIIQFFISAPNTLSWIFTLFVDVSFSNSWRFNISQASSNYWYSYKTVRHYNFSRALHQAQGHGFHLSMSLYEY